jgi:hypothetical protein
VSWTAVALAAAAAAGGGGIDFHDARYCEIFELKGALPDMTAVVWNTIGENACPKAWWESLDPAEIADERGDTAVVLNGPRHFLMDAAEAKTYGKHRFEGQTLTKVATISLRTADDLVQTPWTDRTIERVNTWTWKKGRRVFELVAPGGDTYIMQSYSQQVDASLKLAKLPGLGKRLDLPDGWRYRSRTLRKALTLRAKGAATIIQDDLKNTYQLAKATRPPGKRITNDVHVDGRTKNVPSDEPGMVEDRGTVTGIPFGPGTVVIQGSLADGKFDGTFRLRFKRGSIVGRATMPYTIADGEIDFVGTGRFTGGTGLYRGISSGELQLHDHNTIDGQNGVVTVDGTATY